MRRDVMVEQVPSDSAGSPAAGARADSDQRPADIGREHARRRPGRGGLVRGLAGNKAVLAATVFLALLVILAIAAPLLAPYKPDVIGTGPGLGGPSGDHWLGTDALGRDTLSRLLVAVRITLLAAAQGLAVSLVLGVPLGLLAGYIGRIVDTLLSRIFDALLSLPPLIFALGIIGVLGPGLTNAMLAIGIVMAPRFFRVARVAAEGVRHEGYIEACRAVGVSDFRIVWRHILPNSSGPLLVQASFTIGLVISAEASLSFLGLGVQLPQASWGSMFRTAFDSASSDWFQLVPPGVMITLTVLAMFVIGDALRDTLGKNSRDR